ncbi:hypothetical protein CH06BL_09910 [Chromobacterium haemolyticum]|nr:hypothetical protein CH06BL_09910 [Chromobacterium haemolyticum]
MAYCEKPVNKPCIHRKDCHHFREDPEDDDEIARLTVMLFKTGEIEVRKKGDTTLLMRVMSQ